MSVRLCLAFALLLVGSATISSPRSHAEGVLSVPMVPCAGQSPADFGALGAPPSINLWKLDTLPPEWQPASCSGIERRQGAVLVSVAGRFESRLRGQDLLAKLGSVSQHTSIDYWSVSSRNWQPLLEAASALAGPDLTLARDDFGLDELKSGETLYLSYDDAEPVGPIVNAVDIVKVHDDGFTITTRNVTPAKMIGLTIADPGDISNYLSVEREAGNVYRYFALASSALSMPLLQESTHINRAVAVYRYIAGIKDDQEPPAAPN